MPHGLRLRRSCQETKLPGRLLLIGGINAGKQQKRQGRGRIARGNRSVPGFLGAGNELLGVCAVQEKAAVFRICKFVQQNPEKAPGAGQVVLFRDGGMQCQQGQGVPGVIGKGSVAFPFAVPPACRFRPSGFAAGRFRSVGPHPGRRTLPTSWPPRTGRRS